MIFLPIILFFALSATIDSLPPDASPKAPITQERLKKDPYSKYFIENSPSRRGPASVEVVKEYDPYDKFYAEF